MRAEWNLPPKNHDTEQPKINLPIPILEVKESFKIKSHRFVHAWQELKVLDPRPESSPQRLTSASDDRQIQYEYCPRRIPSTGARRHKTIQRPLTLLPLRLAFLVGGPHSPHKDCLAGRTGRYSLDNLHHLLHSNLRAVLVWPLATILTATPPQEKADGQIFAVSNLHAAS